MAVYPILFQKGSITIYTYGVFIALALVFTRLSIHLYAYQQERDIVDFLNRHLFGILISSIVGARLFFVFEHLSLFTNNPISIIMIQQGGLSFFGGLLFAFFYLLISSSRHSFSFLQVMDLLLPSLSLGQSIGRIGCYFAGCCAGSIEFMPIQLLSSLCHFVIFLLLLLIRYRFKPSQFVGLSCGSYLLLHGLFRFFISFYRTHTVPTYYHLKIHQWICLALIAGGFYLVNRSFKRTSN